MKIKIFFLVLFFSIQSLAADRVLIFYDSTKHRLSSLPLNISSATYDLGKSVKILETLNKRLVNVSGNPMSPSDMEQQVKKAFKNNSSFKRAIVDLKNSYQYTQLISDYRITKIPAVVLDAKDGDYVVYGETNIQKALKDIALYRRSRSD